MYKTILCQLFSKCIISGITLSFFYLMFVEELYAQAASGQNSAQSVQGKISDFKGEALVGVNALIKGTLTGTVSDVEGHYSIRVPDDKAILVFSYLGYLTEEVLRKVLCQDHTS